MGKPKGKAPGQAQEAGHEAELLVNQGAGCSSGDQALSQNQGEKLEKQVQQLELGMKIGMGITLVDPGKETKQI